MGVEIYETNFFFFEKQIYETIDNAEHVKT